MTFCLVYFEKIMYNNSWEGEMENNFAKNLKKLRTQNGLTQLELAQKLGKDYSTIGKWELGQRSPAMADILKIASIFKVNIEDLISGQRDIKKSEDEILKQKIDNLSKDQKDIINKMIDNMK